MPRITYLSVETMKVRLIKFDAENEWYHDQKERLDNVVFKVFFSEEHSQRLSRKVYEVLKGPYKGKLIDVKDTQIVVKIKK